MKNQRIAKALTPGWPPTRWLAGIAAEAAFHCGRRRAADYVRRSAVTVHSARHVGAVPRGSCARDQCRYLWPSSAATQQWASYAITAGVRLMVGSPVAARSLASGRRGRWVPALVCWITAGPTGRRGPAGVAAGAGKSPARFLTARVLVLVSAAGQPLLGPWGPASCPMPPCGAGRPDSWRRWCDGRGTLRVPEPGTFWLPVSMVLAARGSLSEDHRGCGEPLRVLAAGVSVDVGVGAFGAGPQGGWVAASPRAISGRPRRFLASCQRGCRALLVLGPAGALDPCQRRWLPVPWCPTARCCPGATSIPVCLGSRCHVPCDTFPSDDA